MQRQRLPRGPNRSLQIETHNTYKYIYRERERLPRGPNRSLQVGTNNTYKYIYIYIEKEIARGRRRPVGTTHHTP